MTQEKFERIVKIHHRLDELKTVMDEIQSNKTHKLIYTAVPEWKQKAIGDLLDKHDRMIREEIDQEIDRLNKEIESL